MITGNHPGATGSTFDRRRQLDRLSPRWPRHDRALVATGFPSSCALSRPPCRGWGRCVGL